jgi:1-acyl-sn-glycerol-3-phosphate acyltransferase
LRIYFRRLELFHPERVPPEGPVLFASNHPGSVTDAFIIGTSVPRRVHFVATVRLFRFKPLAWLLKQCGLIPINRLKDDPRAMRTVAETFEACFQLLESGEAVGIFPEGITYDDAQLKTVKTGAARMVLELEHRHDGRLGSKIVPVGLTYSAKERYRSEVLVHFGEPIQVGKFVGSYDTRRKECISELSAELERRLRALIAHFPQLERASVVEAVKRLYLERLKLGNRVVKEPLRPRAEELVLTQAIASAVEWTEGRFPERLRALARRLKDYERWRMRLRLPNDAVEPGFNTGNPLARGLGRALLGIVGAPVALYGWAHRLLPRALVRWVASRFTDPLARKAQTPHASMLAGLVAFGGCYAFYVWLVHRWFGWPVSLWYALSLPGAGLVAHYYFQGLGRFADAWRTVVVFTRCPFAAKRLARLHSELIAEIESLRSEYRRALQSGSIAPAK